MVSALKFFRRDPMYPAKNRGQGYYYFRGKLTTGLLGSGMRNPDGFRGAYWSKYSPTADGNNPRLPTKVQKVASKEETQPHKGDYKTRKAKRGDSNKVKVAKTGTSKTRGGFIKNRKTTRAGTGSRGYF